MAGSQLAVYSERALQTKPQRTVAGRQLAVYSRGGFAEEGRQRRRRRRKEEEERRRKEGRTGRTVEI